MGALALLVAVAAPAPALAQAPPAPPAGAGSARPAQRLPIEVEGATTVEYDAQTERYTFRGPRVVVTRGDERLEAPEILYDAAVRRAELPRRGRVSSPTMALTADTLTADLGRRHLFAVGAVEGRFLDAGVWMTLVARQIVADDRADLRRAEATGDAVAIRGDERLQGDRIVYNRSTQHGTVEGHAVAVRGGDRLEADRIEADLANHDGVATGHVVLDRASMHMHGVADRGTYSEHADAIVLTGHAVVTRDRDVVEADQITVHLRENRATAEGRARVVAYPQESQP